jgi:hypothetical protein
LIALGGHRAANSRWAHSHPLREPRFTRLTIVNRAVEWMTSWRAQHPAPRPRAHWWLLLSAVLGLLAGAGAAVAAGNRDDGKGRARGRAAALAPVGGALPCGGEAGAVAAHSASDVARRIYQLELSSPEVRANRRQVESNEPLLRAMTAGEPAAIRSAVTALVFSGTHIVRLRVIAHGAVLADVGGPYIIAPVGGVLRFQGRSVGRYLLSVQDDLGYVKLEQRFIGAPMSLRSGGRRVPVEGTIATSPPLSGPASYAGASYQAVSFTARAFPSGSLGVTLLVAAPASSSQSCRTVAERELFSIGERVWRRFIAVSAPLTAYAHTLGSLTGASVFVRAGSRQLAGSTSPRPPLRDSGSVRWRGRLYDIGSFPSHVAGRRVRVFQLLPVG